MGEQARLHDRIGGQHGEIGEVLGNQGVVDRDLLAVQPARVLPGQTSAPARAGEGERDPGKRGISRIFVRDAKAVTGRKTGRRCQSKDRRGARRREGHRADVRAVLLHIEHGFAGRGNSRVPGLLGSSRAVLGDLGQHSCRAQIRQMHTDIERLGDGHKRGAVPPRAAARWRCPRGPHRATRRSRSCQGSGPRYRQPGRRTRHRTASGSQEPRSAAHSPAPRSRRSRPEGAAA